jgi:hypothetical protein
MLCVKLFMVSLFLTEQVARRSSPGMNRRERHPVVLEKIANEFLGFLCFSASIRREHQKPMSRFRAVKPRFEENPVFAGRCGRATSPVSQIESQRPLAARCGNAARATGKNDEG